MHTSEDGRKGERGASGDRGAAALSCGCACTCMHRPHARSKRLPAYLPLCHSPSEWIEAVKACARGAWIKRSAGISGLHIFQGGALPQHRLYKPGWATRLKRPHPSMNPTLQESSICGQWLLRIDPSA